ncbi:hypothetical protein ACFVZ3_39215 [Kitasatospora purpeofusca]|uniref:hypothetical protein n=1 Tax=Kitasatospora purpeofusca TaxID=67352 RepID=UPI00367DB0D8
MSEPLLLRFPLADVLPLAEHAVAAEDHQFWPYTDESGPCLVWVKQRGTFLVSNGLPHLSGADKTRVLVHAEGWGPDTENDLADTPVGGDDFEEYFSLTESLPGDATTTLEQVRAAVADGLLWFVLEVTETSVTIAFSA